MTGFYGNKQLNFCIVVSFFCIIVFFRSHSASQSGSRDTKLVYILLKLHNAYGLYAYFAKKNCRLRFCVLTILILNILQ